MSRDPIKVGNLEIHVVVRSLRDGGFTFAIVETDRTSDFAIENRYESDLRFETEDAAYAGGSSEARRRAKKAST